MSDGSAYPIIYVRGFAGGTSGIDTATDDPFYGFNDGATHVRVGGDGNPQFYQFEGPLVRLMEDEDYRVPVHGGQQIYLTRSADGSQPRTAVWIYRFYDASADTFNVPAAGLRPADRGQETPRLRPARPGQDRLHRPGREPGDRQEGVAGRAFDGRPDLPQHDPEDVPG